MGDKFFKILPQLSLELYLESRPTHCTHLQDEFNTTSVIKGEHHFQIQSFFVLLNKWQINGFRSDWNDWCVQGGFTQDPSVPAAPLMEGFVLAKQEGVIRGQYMEAVASSGSLL